MTAYFNKNGWRVKLHNYDESKYVSRSVHVLVAIQFIPNPKKLPRVRHLDGNFDNYAVSNLQWIPAPKSIGVIQRSIKSGKIIAKHASIKAAVRALGKPETYKTHIQKALKGHGRALGYHWTREDML